MSGERRRRCISAWKARKQSCSKDNSHSIARNAVSFRPYSPHKPFFFFKKKNKYMYVCINAAVFMTSCDRAAYQFPVRHKTVMCSVLITRTHVLRTIKTKTIIVARSLSEPCLPFLRRLASASRWQIVRTAKRYEDDEEKRRIQTVSTRVSRFDPITRCDKYERNTRITSSFYRPKIARSTPDRCAVIVSRLKNEKQHVF